MLCFPMKQQISQHFQLHPLCRASVKFRKAVFFGGGNLGWLSFFLGEGATHLALIHPFFLLVCSFWGVFSSFSFL